MQKKVHVTEKPTNVSWIGTRDLDVKDGCIKMMNNNEFPVFLHKYQHLADIRTIKQVKMSQLREENDMSEIIKT